MTILTGEHAWRVCTDREEVMNCSPFVESLFDGSLLRVSWHDDDGRHYEAEVRTGELTVWVHDLDTDDQAV